jgi:TolB-like protein
MKEAMVAVLFPVSRPRRMAARPGTPALSAGVLLSIGLLGLMSAMGCARTDPSYDRRVLVMDFQNMVPGEESAPLGRSLADMLTANLTNHPRIAVVERQANPALVTGNWREAGERAEVDYVVIGSLSRLENNYIVAIRLLSMVTGEVVKGSAVERYCNREEDLYPVVAAMGNVMAHHLQVLAQRHEAWSQQQPKGFFARLGGS